MHAALGAANQVEPLSLTGLDGRERAGLHGARVTILPKEFARRFLDGLGERCLIDERDVREVGRLGFLGNAESNVEGSCGNRAQAALRENIRDLE